jgi:hypothetical protein
MPRFIQSKNLPMKWCRPHIERYRRQLRDALMNPALTQEQKDQLKTRLSNLGKEKPYATLAAKAAAVNASSEAASTPDVADATSELLVTNHNKDELLTIAQDEGIEVSASWTKTKIAEAIVAARS